MPPRNREQRMIDGFRDRRKDPAYRNGWGDGRFGLMETFLENPNLARWESHPERLAYYRGHRDGRRGREEPARQDPAWSRPPRGPPRAAGGGRGAGAQGPRLIAASLGDTSADAGPASGRRFRAPGRRPF